MSHRHKWLFVDEDGKPLDAWVRRCNCGVVQTLKGSLIAEVVRKRTMRAVIKRVGGES